jgi:hypothetical protein
LAKIKREIWGGIIEYAEDDTPSDIRSFNEFGKSLALWQMQSRALHAAARAVIEKSDLYASIALMLAAYATETLLKTVIIYNYCRKNGPSLDSKKSGDFVPRIHDLTKLVSKSGLRTNKTDREILNELSRYSVWAGKYPIPLDSSNYDGPALIGQKYQNQSLWAKYVPLYKKLDRLSVRSFRASISN